MNIVFCGGGTAGHVVPNIALIEKLNCDCYYVGTNGMEKQLIAPLVGKKVKAYFEIDAQKFQRKFTMKNLALPFSLLKSVNQCKKILKSLRPCVTFSKGGYCSLPVAIASKSLNIPVIVFESDSSLGLANKICFLFAKQKLSSFSTIKNATCVGAILKENIALGNKERGLKTMGLDGKKPVLLVAGGSLGAKTLNETVCKAKPLAEKFDIFVITGKNKKVDCDFIKQKEYVDNIHDVYSASDVALCRAGANTLFELTKCKIPFLTVPLCKSSRGEQKQNAKIFCDANCGILLEEKNLTPTTLTDRLEKLIKNKTYYQKNQEKFCVDGTDKIVSVLMNELEQLKK